METFFQQFQHLLDTLQKHSYEKNIQITILFNFFSKKFDSKILNLFEK